MQTLHQHPCSASKERPSIGPEPFRQAIHALKNAFARLPEKADNDEQARPRRKGRSREKRWNKRSIEERDRQEKRVENARLENNDKGKDHCQKLRKGFDELGCAALRHQAERQG